MPKKKANGNSPAPAPTPPNSKRHGTPQSLNAAVKSICDIMRRSNVALHLTTWLESHIDSLAHYGHGWRRLRFESEKALRGVTREISL